MEDLPGNKLHYFIPPEKASFQINFHVYEKSKDSYSYSRDKMFFLQNYDCEKEIILEEKKAISKSNEIKNEIKKECEEKEKEKELKSSRLKEMLLEIENDVINEQFASLGEQKSTEDYLWSDRYQPIKYCDLITDEKLNRECINWLKYIENPNLVKEEEEEMLNSNINHNFNKYSFQQKFKPFQHRSSLIISGASGIGKSTLARVIGHQRNYNVIEINANNCKTKSLIDQVYNAATLDHLKNGKISTEKSLIIIDEIDGSNDIERGSAIKEIASYLQTGMFKRDKRKGKMKRMKNKIEIGSNITNENEKHSQENDEKISENEMEENEDIDNLLPHDGQKIQRKKKQVKIKPIIFICNDIYLKILKPIKDISEHKHIWSIDTQRLTNRLMEILKLEEINIDKALLNQIIANSGDDIRSALNNLQLATISYKIFPSLLEKKNLNLNSKSKDQFLNIFEIMNKVIQTKIGNDTTYQACKNLRSILSKSGQSSEVVDGITHNFYEQIPITVSIDRVFAFFVFLNRIFQANIMCLILL